MIPKKLSNALIMFLEPFIAPRPDRMMFMSYHGKYTDSPRLVSEKLHEMYPNLKHVWLIDPQKVSVEDLPDYVVPIFGFKARWYRATCKVVVDNSYGDGRVELAKGTGTLKRFLKKRKDRVKGRKIMTTFHGTPLKKIGRDQVGSAVENVYSEPTVMMLGNKHSMEVYQRASFGKAEVLLTGTPRNDVLATQNDADTAAVKERLGLPLDKKILLYAPTFRSDSSQKGKNVRMSGIEQVENLDFSLLFDSLSDKFGGSWAAALRFHYYVEELVDWKQMQARFPGLILNGNHGDMSDYLRVADCLLTDASSCMFDYALTKKPVFLLFPDYDHFRDAERGFYLNVESLPFPLAKNYRELYEKIANFEQICYAEKLDTMMDELGYLEDGHATERVANLVAKEMGYTS